MVFISIPYFCLLVVVAILHYSLFRKQQWILLLIASYIFYSSVYIGYSFILFGVSLWSYLAGLYFSRYRPKYTSLLLLTAVFVTFLPLLIYKYADFFTQSFLPTLLQINSGSLALNFLLPIGISFWFKMT